FWFSLFSYCLYSASSCSSSNSLILREILSSDSLTSSTFTSMTCPTSSTSSGVPMCLLAIWEICTSPSTPGNTSTKAPKLTRRFTVPSTTSPLSIFCSTFSQGPGKVFLRDNEMRSLSLSMDITSTLMTSPILTTSDLLSTCSCASCEMCTSPSTPPISTKAPNLVVRCRVPSRTCPSSIVLNNSCFLESASSSITIRCDNMTLFCSLLMSTTFTRSDCPL